METWIKIVLIFVAASLPMRCVGEWKQERDRVAYIEERVEQRRMPDCMGKPILFTVDKHGLYTYFCGR